MLPRTPHLPPLPPLPALSGPEEEILLITYSHQFGPDDRCPLGGGDDPHPSSREDRGRYHPGVRPDGFAWRTWAEAASLSEREAIGPVLGLVEANLAEFADPDGERIWLLLGGVLWAETRSLFVEPALVERQKALRRRIVAALSRARGACDFGGAVSGRTVEHMAAELGMPRDTVLANCRVLAGLGIVLAAPAGGGLLRDAGGRTPDGWPLH